MPLSIKICGMTRPDNIREVAALHPDWVGLIFHAASPRNALSLLPEALREARTIIASEVGSVPRFAGVFVNRPADEILAAAESYGLDAVQLHGDETPDFCASLRGKGFEVWKAVGIETPDDFLPLENYAGKVDRFVFDRKSPKRGGTGEKFDWRHLDAYTLPVGFMLGGGLGPDDGEAAARVAHPQLIGFDLNSRFEISPGIKNALLLSSFLANVRKRHD